MGVFINIFAIFGLINFIALIVFTVIAFKETKK